MQIIIIIICGICEPSKTNERIQDKTSMRQPIANKSDSNGSLWDLPLGKKCRIEGFRGGLEKNYRTRLRDLGFHQGEIVTCVMTPRLGAPRLYRVHNTVYSMDDQVARQIQTTILDGQ